MIYFSHPAVVSEMQRLPRKQIGRTAMQAFSGKSSHTGSRQARCHPAPQLHAQTHHTQSTESSLLPVWADPLKAGATGSQRVSGS